MENAQVGLSSKLVSDKVVLSPTIKGLFTALELADVVPILQSRVTCCG